MTDTDRGTVWGVAPAIDYLWGKASRNDGKTFGRYADALRKTATDPTHTGHTAMVFAFGDGVVALYIDAANLHTQALDASARKIRPSARLAHREDTRGVVHVRYYLPTN